MIACAAKFRTDAICFSDVGNLQAENGNDITDATDLAPVVFVISCFLNLRGERCPGPS
jgi:hypothetical protein